MDRFLIFLLSHPLLSVLISFFLSSCSFLDLGFNFVLVFLLFLLLFFSVLRSFPLFSYTFLLSHPFLLVLSLEFLILPFVGVAIPAGVSLVKFSDRLPCFFLILRPSLFVFVLLALFISIITGFK